MTDEPSELIRAAVEARGWSHTDLARACRDAGLTVSRQGVTRWGQPGVVPAELARSTIARVLGLDYEAFNAACRAALMRRVA